jgi:dUTP pyrophosphatase
MSEKESTTIVVSDNASYISNKGIIKFLKVRDVKSPNRANEYDAGIDFYVPEFTESFIKDLKEKNPNINLRIAEDSDGTPDILLEPHERILIPSGIHCQMSTPNRALIAANKSGVATKKGLIFGAQVVDYEYQGEIHISLINSGNETAIISGGMKAIQFLEMPIYTSFIDITENQQPNEFYMNVTTRGAGGFGSTNNK